MDTDKIKQMTTMLMLALGSLLLVAFAPASHAQSQSAGAIDTIAAIVNDDVITLRTVERELQRVKKDLDSQNIPLPDDETLRVQVLERLITEKILEQQADELGIQVTDDDVQRAVHVIAQNNDLSLEGLQAEIKQAGLSWDEYLDSLRYDILVDQLRFRALDDQINISETEIDAFLKTHGASPQQSDSMGMADEQDELIELAQIVIRVPESSTVGQERELRNQIDSIVKELQGGADFATLAASFSDGNEALSGGHLGVRPLEGWPDLFIEAIRDLAPGETSGVIRTGQGFHILKVTNRGTAEPVVRQRASAPDDQAGGGPLMVTQTKARHILIKLSQVVSDEQARERLVSLRQRIEHGEDFADLARSYSEDPSAPQGGDLGWISPGETVPPFEQAMDALAVGEVSQPIRSPFGWHLIQVLDRREKDMSDEYQRLEARQILYEQYAEPAFENWLGQVRGQAYVDNRLDPSRSSRTASRRRQ